MTIFVTGGAGFIGSNFIFHMLNTYPNYRIVCLDKLTYAGNLSTLEPVMSNPKFRFVKIDICDREAIYKLFEEEKPDIVVNFAAESHVDRSIENPEIFLQTNIRFLIFLTLPTIMKLTAGTIFLLLNIQGNGQSASLHIFPRSSRTKQQRFFLRLLKLLTCGEQSAYSQIPSIRKTLEKAVALLTRQTV